MAGKFFTWPKLLIIFVTIIIVIVGVIWYASYNAPSTSTFQLQPQFHNYKLANSKSQHLNQAQPQAIL